MGRNTKWKQIKMQSFAYCNDWNFFEHSRKVLSKSIKWFLTNLMFVIVHVI